MRQFLRRHIPSMFQRRLLLLLLALLLATAALGAQLARLTVGPNHLAMREEAESALRVPELIPTRRGRILDRKGRVLAEDEPAYDVTVDYDVISGRWAYRQALSAARKRYGKQWRELDALQRQAAVAEAQNQYDREVALLWRTLADLGGVSPLEIEHRKDAIRRRVQLVASEVTLRNQQRQMNELEEPVAWTQARVKVREEYQAHSILRDVSKATQAAVERFIAEAQRQSALPADQRDKALEVWQSVQLRRPRHRRYPLHKMTFLLDRSILPSAIRSNTKQQVTVNNVAMHLVGRLRDVWPKDMERRPYRHTNARDQTIIDLGGYLEGDRTGQGGIEETYEDLLRGERGRRVRHLDTQSEDRLEPTPGRDVHLTIDAHLQGRIQALMDPSFGLMKVGIWHNSEEVVKQRDGMPLDGAAVVMDIDTGEVLAAVSAPGYPMPDDETDGDDGGADVSSVNESAATQPEDRYPRLPYLNRTVSRSYPPGSTLKPLVLLAATDAHVHALGQPIDCEGHLYPKDPYHFRCWIFKEYGLTHGPLTASQAIARSCDIYFYTLGRMLGPQRFVDAMREFGLGSVTHCGLPDETRGSLPAPSKLTSTDTTFMGIGQGPIGWTPMQAVAEYGMLARHGLYLSPTIIMPRDRKTPQQRVQLPVNQAAVAEAIKGIDEVVNAHYGTGRYLVNDHHHELIFTAPGVKVYGKTGTADPGARWIDRNRNHKIDKGEIDKHPGDHAWFCALLQPDGASRPTIAVAVVVEYAGSGGAVSGPIVNQIIYALKAEGYL